MSVTERALQPRAQVEVDQAVSPPPGHARFPLFDSMRAIAALAVVVFHASQAAVIESGRLEPAWWEGLAARMTVGVPIFFLISGFLLYRPFTAARLAGRRAPTLGAYARRRVLRIVPAFWVALIVLMPLGLAWFPGGLFPDGLLIFGFLQVYSEETFTAGLGVSWSLAVEASFYVLLPAYAWLAARLIGTRDADRAVRWELAALTGLGLASVAFTAAMHSAGRPALAETLPGTFLWFALGMGLAVISAAGWGRDSRAVALIDRRPWVPWAVAAALLAGSGTIAGLPGVAEGFPLPHTTGQWALEKVLYGLIAFLLLLPAVFGSGAGGGVRRLLASPALMWIGLVSYGIYLWHGAVIHWVRGSGSLPQLAPEVLFLVILGLALAVTPAIAALSYYLVERPALSFKDGFDARATARAFRATVGRVQAPARVAVAVDGTGPAGHWQRSLHGGRTAPAAARASVTELLGDRLAGEELEVLRLLVDEVVTNSVLHGGVGDDGEIGLEITAESDRVRVEVRDTGRQGMPELRTPDLRLGNGLGLFLVNRLASRWGSAHEPRLRVWFEVARGGSGVQPA